MAKTRRRPKKKNISLLPWIAGAVLLAAAGYGGYYWYQHPSLTVVTKLFHQPTRDEQIADAVSRYLDDQEYLLANKLSVQFQAEADNFARIALVPKDPTLADPAIGFLQKKGDDWEVVMIGTAFEPETYDKFKIPQSLRLE